MLLSRRTPVGRQIRTFESLEQRLPLTAGPTVTAVEIASSTWDTDFYDYLESENLGEYGYAIPAGSEQEQQLPWTNLDRVYITFSEDVDVDLADLAVTGVNHLQYQISDFFYDPQLKTARWTFSDTFESDRILFDLDSDGADPVKDLSGNALDGEWVNSSSSFSSGNGTAGGDFEFTIAPLLGDALQDGIVTWYDYFYVYYAAGQDTTNASYNPTYDIDGSGDITSADYGFIYTQLGEYSVTSSPAGLSNDAPTSAGRIVADLDNPAIDEAFSLYSLFDDNEDADSSLNYSIVSNSNSSLFDSVSINTSTGELIANTATSASGRAEIVVSATDSNGLEVQETLVFDVSYENTPPEISYFVAEGDIVGTWIFEGFVHDPDESTAGWIVEMSGVFNARGVVYPDGWFIFSAILPPGTNGYQFVEAVDMFGATDTASLWVGIT